MHNGHRERLFNRFLKQDLDGFDNINAIELLLFFSIPRIDTNPLAHRLLNTFGSFSGAFDAPYEELIKVEGIGEKSAVLIKFMSSFSRYYNREKSLAGKMITSASEAGEYIKPYFIGINDEVVYMISLDHKCRILTVQKISEGSKDSAHISLRKIGEVALKTGATKIILAHNHPGGIALPSQADIDTTYEIIQAISLFNISLLDHIIVADGDYVSLNESGFIKQSFKK